MIAHNSNPWFHIAHSHCHLRMLTAFFCLVWRQQLFVKPICNVSFSGLTLGRIPSAGFYQKLIA